MASDLSALWDYGDPELSEQRFLEAMAGASPTERLVLQTQIARTYGLRQEFDRARELLGEVPNHAETAPEVEARYHLEMGRTYCSATHSGELSPEAKELARRHYGLAFEAAERGALDYLAIDALHMMTFVDSDPEDQIAWNLKAIAFMDRSSQSDAKRWEGSLRNNLGYALHLCGRYEEAISAFSKALEFRRSSGERTSVWIARWMIAWTRRAMGDIHGALREQLEMESERAADGEPSPYVFQELEILYRELGNVQKANEYSRLAKGGPG